MKWTYDWLKQYLKTDADPQKIADALTRIGLEIEEVCAPIAPIVARIESCEPVTGSDHLHVLQVNDGTGKLRQVVCGAPNARAGLVSALALPGCVVGGHEIKSGKLRGVLSDGMMCSEKELGISDNHDGIMELPSDSVIGTPVIDMPTVFDAGITPNRPDYLAVRGIARDLAAARIGEYVDVQAAALKPVKSARNVEIMTDKCAVYQMCEIHGVNMSPSNRTIAARLAAIGINPKNAAIDATNYVCYDMAQPMHCFDADEIHGDIVVRQASAGEEFTDLFGAKHTLLETDMVVADDNGILALAGVIGGARASTTDATKNIILESAYFDPVCVRKTSKRLGISTDASYRYERGIDPTITGDALAMAANIIMAQCGGEIVGTVVAGKIPDGVVQIEYSPNLFSKKTGIEMSPETQREILEKLGFGVSQSGDKWIVTPRAARVDVVIPETIVAELLRIYGYDKIASAAKHKNTIGAAHKDLNLALKRALASRGLNENISFGFGNAATEELLTDKAHVKIANPITVELDTARNTLLENLLIAVSENEKRGFSSLNLFELGTVFDGDNPGEQHTQICIVRTGDNAPRHWSHRNRSVDIFDVKADLISLMQGQKFTVATDNAPRWAHPFRYGAFFQGKKKIAEFGELHPMVAKKLRIKTNVVVAIVDDIENLPLRRRRGVLDASEFQPITRDFAFIVDAAFPAEKIIGNALASDDRITDAVVFDAFDLPDGKKSIAFTITIQPRQNMSDEDLLQLQNSVIARVESKCGAKIRDK